MHVEKMSFKHKDALYEKLKKMGATLSDYNFANLYLFRDVHNYEVIFDKELFIKGKTYDDFTYIMPTEDPRKINLTHLKELMKGVDFCYPIAEEWLEAFNIEGFRRSYKDGDSDYIYTLEKMATYKGRRLHKKRNLLKQFVTLYEHAAHPLTEERIEDAVSVLEAWQKDMGIPSGETDYHPCLEALRMREKLVLCGIIYYANKEAAGFILGAELGNEVFVLNFAKGKRKFKGIYQYMYNNLANLLPKKYKYFNFEEDLDKEALKVAKSSYVPDAMLKKYRVTVKK
ncbi:MAG: DUF2156 domain-containing protein [Candidatus Omnitrophota bacterium]|nr:MAG: DUF2156 domain-containing protein [Candidatus Omnitrophota bacterium]